ncbi:hypothetical protein [Chitinophaga sp. RAB17]|uniref:hypothetical protein n=1 Tax=Chitinophaga sp. RAB17 TaxID=3233049 RepID=UPI003F8F7C35
MRSFVALMTCIGCIAWIHSCEKRLLGVRIEKNSLTPDNQLQQLPVAILPDNIPAHYISQVTSAPMSSPVVRPRNKLRTKKQTGIANKTTDSLLFNLAVVKGQYSIYNNTTP